MAERVLISMQMSNLNEFQLDFCAQTHKKAGFNSTERKHEFHYIHQRRSFHKSFWCKDTDKNYCKFLLRLDQVKTTFIRRFLNKLDKTLKFSPKSWVIHIKIISSNRHQFNPIWDTRIFFVELNKFWAWSVKSIEPIRNIWRMMDYLYIFT